MSVNQLLLLTDYKGAFYSSTRNVESLCTMNVSVLVQYFESLGYVVETTSYAKIDMSRDYRKTVVLYTSSEDYGLYYRSYIEDVVLALKEKGARLIPDYPYFRAHHNKVFMEMLRDILLPDHDRLLIGTFGAYEEMLQAKIPEGKYVLKKAAGAGSSGVLKSENNAELRKCARKLSRNPSIVALLKEWKHRVLYGKKYYRTSRHCQKFVVQRYVEELSGDFKVLKYGSRFYTVYRENRKNDFRASGSGRLTFEFPAGVCCDSLLDFARGISDNIHTPLLSMDIAFDGDRFYLIEFQCMHFGPYAAECSDHYYEYENEEWVQHDEPCDLERVFCDAIHSFIAGSEFKIC
ncbi:MAG: hypothetical protein RRY72_08040 [Bacteroides sp.]